MNSIIIFAGIISQHIIIIIDFNKYFRVALLLKQQNLFDVLRKYSV